MKIVFELTGISKLQNGRLNVTENVTEKRLDIIMDIIKKDNTITTEEIAEKLNLTKRTILRDIDKLKSINKIKYTGPAKGGHWEVIQV